MEIWKDIIKLNNRYQISNKGNIRNKETRIILIPQIQKAGYYRFSCKPFFINGDKRTISILIHQAVAISFIDNPNNYREVNHKDGDKSNNNVDNLEWCTRKHNIKHAFQNNLKSHRGIKNTRSKLSESDVLEIYKSNIRSCVLCIQYNVSSSTINDIRKGRSWTHITQR